MTCSDMFAGLSRGGFLSQSGSCKTLDDSADGYCRGEAVGVVVLKRLEDAIADNDNIQAIIRSVATNHSAQAISLTHPHCETQQKLFRRVLRDVSVEPDDIGYVELHGTGTQAGDVAEAKSVAAVFGNSRPEDDPLYVGSLKPNIGHGEAVRPHPSFSLPHDANYIRLPE
jgi:acyl transferase domain-containing protein